MTTCLVPLGFRLLQLCSLFCGGPAMTPNWRALRWRQQDVLDRCDGRGGLDLSTSERCERNQQVASGLRHGPKHELAGLTEAGRHQLAAPKTTEKGGCMGTTLVKKSTVASGTC